LLTRKNGPRSEAILICLVFVTVTFDDGYAITAMFPAAMPAVVMNTILWASVLAIAFTIVIPMAISIIADVNAS
jgi:hypothetical protein